MNEFNMLKFNLESAASGLGYKRCLNFQVNIGAKKNTGFLGKEIGEENHENKTNLSCTTQKNTKASTTNTEHI